MERSTTITPQVYDSLYFKSRYKNFFLSKVGITNIYYLWTAFFCIILPSNLKKGDRVLDFGCGVGNLVWALRFWGIKALGIDPSKNAKLISKQPKFCIYTSFRKLPFKNSSFKIVYSNEVLEHIDKKDIPWYLSELQRISKGKMIHMVCVKERGKIAFTDPTHVTIETEDWWENTFKKLGFSVKKGNWFYFFPNIFTGKLNYLAIKKGYFFLEQK